MRTQDSSSVARPTTFALTFPAADAAHLAALDLEQLGFRAVVTWPDDGWLVEAGALMASDGRRALPRRMVDRIAHRYGGELTGETAGWRAGQLELHVPA